MTSRRPVLPAAAALALLVLLLFRESLGGGVFYKRDIHLVWHPQVEGLVRAVAEGALPVWDPSPAFGQPLLADPGAQVLYPPTWLNLVLRPWTYYTVFALGHVLLAALSFLALARRWGLRPLASAAGAATFTLSGPFLSLVDLWHHFAGASYLPAAVLCAQDALEERGWRQVLRLGLVLGLQLLAGSADASVMTALVLAAWWLVRLQPGRWRSAAVSAGRVAVAFLVALAIGAGVWVAALDAASRSSRGSLPEEVRTYWSLHPLGLAEVVLAGVPSALPLDRSARDRLYEGREPFLFSLYLGLPGLALAALAGGSGQRRRLAGLLLVAALAVLLALGRFAPFYGAASLILPPLGLLRYPVKAMVLAAFAWAGLVALGAEAAARVAARGGSLALRLAPALLAALAAAATATAILGGPPGRVLGLGLDPEGVLLPVGRRLGLHALLGVAAVLALLASARTRSRWGAAAATAAVVLDLALAHPRPNPAAPRELYTHRPEILAALPPFPRVYAYNYGETGRPRAWMADPPGRLRGVPDGFAPDAASALAEQMRLAPQTPGRWGVRQGFDVDYRGLHAEPVVLLTRAARVLEEDPEALVRLLRLGAVTHVLALHDVAGGRLPLVAEVPGLARGAIRAYAVVPPPARARVVGGARVADGLKALGVLLDPGFDPEAEVLLARGAAHGSPPGFAGRARLLEERSDALRIEVDLSHDGYLVLADTHDPGWRARVDGRDAQVLRANLAFRAVRLTPGRHQVAMIYRPGGVLAAASVSLLAFAVALGSLAALSRARPMQP